LLHATQTGILGLAFSGKLFVEPEITRSKIIKITHNRYCHFNNENCIS